MQRSLIQSHARRRVYIRRLPLNTPSRAVAPRGRISDAFAMDLDHHHFMREALALAAQAASLGEIPVGALIVHHPAGAEPRIIGTGINRRETDADPSAHAEIVAMREAGKALGYWRLVDCTLYVTLEPCPMCAGALVQSRLTRLVYGCRDPKAGCVDSLYHLCTDPRVNHQVEVLSDVLADESAALLKSFFAARRAARKFPPPANC